MFPSGENAIVKMSSVCPVNVRSKVQVAVSQSLTALSPAAIASKLPSGENATHRCWPVPCSTFTTAPSETRQIRTVVSKLAGGVWMNVGSAVVMPEVFLKAVAVARNFGCDLDGLVTVNFDKESKYRTGMNVLRRPGSEGIEVIGHHELLLPLLHAAVAAKLPACDNGLSHAA